jgi:hypothetical protein
LETYLSEPAPFSPDSYDLSEAALKGLYLERDDEDVDVARLIADLDGPKKGDQEKSSAGGGQSAGGNDVSHSLAPTIAPLRAPPRETGRSGGPTAKTKPGGKITAAILGVGVLLVLGWANYHPTQTPPAADAAKRPPAIAGLLHVADFAAGRKINPGDNYGVDLPAGKVRVAVVAGEVRLTSKGGESLRACSNQPFVIDAASGPANFAPLITACGREPALLQAEIPPPPLPAPAPVVAISPSTLRSGGD